MATQRRVRFTRGNSSCLRQALGTISRRKLTRTHSTSTQGSRSTRALTVRLSIARRTAYLIGLVTWVDSWTHLSFSASFSSCPSQLLRSSLDSSHFCSAIERVTWQDHSRSPFRTSPPMGTKIKIKKRVRRAPFLPRISIRRISKTSRCFRTCGKTLDR